MTELPSGTVTFLFTDLENSTRLWEQHPDVMPTALDRHYELLQASVERNHGTTVKSTGDGILAVFTRAADAVATAVDTLRSIDSETWGPIGQLAVRIGIHTGTAEFRDGDYAGVTINRANRVMSAAHGGQAIMSQASVDLAREILGDDLAILDLGEHRLRGVARAEHLYQLVIPGLRGEFPPLQTADAFPAGLSLPLPPFAREDPPLAGRQGELHELERAWAQSIEGIRQVALVSGEPGMGKTRLVGELARRVHSDGALVLYGRCDEDAIAPHQPFVEALRPYVERIPTATLRERLHGLEADLARAFPEVLGRMPELSALPREAVGGGIVDRNSERQTERYRLSEAFAMLLTGITARQPLLLVFDDVHWADSLTLLVLRHVLRSVRRAPLLVVACYRDVELAVGHPLSDLLADLRREPSITWIALRGLAEGASTQLARDLLGHQLPVELAESLRRETGGNPFFLEEVLRHLVESDAFRSGELVRSAELGPLDLPQSVRDVITRRLRRLPEATNQVLGAAAVIGPEFDVSVLALAARRSAGDVLDALDHATSAGFVAEQPERIGRYSFAHALVRQAVYAELTTAQRVRLHARVAAAIEEAQPATARLPAVLAHHLALALPLVGASPAIASMTQAGHDAVAELALEDAVGYFERALALLDEHTPTERTQRVELLIDLADAMIFADDRAGAQAAMRAVETARTSGSASQLGRAVTVLAEANAATMMFGEELPRLFSEAKDALQGQDPALRARLLAWEAFKYVSYQLVGGEGRALARDAVALARESNDPLTLADSLFVLATSLEAAPDLSERVALGEELVALGGSVGIRSRTFGLRILAATHLERADGAALESTIAELARIGEESRWLPASAVAAQWRGTRALLEGRFDDVLRHQEEMRRYRRAYGGVAGMRTVQLFFLAREQGEVDVSALNRLADGADRNLYAHVMLALAQLESGDEAAAQHVLEVLQRDDFVDGATEGAWLAMLAILSEIATSCRMRDEAEVLHDLLEPYAGRLLTAHFGLACLGAADRFLGMLDTVLGDWDDAERRFDHALSLEARISGRALLARTQYWRAQYLRARGDRADEHAVDTLLAHVISEASALGMQRLCAQATDLRSA